MRERERERERERGIERMRGRREKETRHFLNQPKIKMILIVNYSNIELIHFF